MAWPSALRGSTPDSRRPGLSGSIELITSVSLNNGDRTRRKRTKSKPTSTTKPAKSSANCSISIGAWISIGVKASSRSARKSTAPFARKTHHSNDIGCRRVVSASGTPPFNGARPERASSEGRVAGGIEVMGSTPPSLSLTLKPNAPSPSCRKRRRDGVRVWCGRSDRIGKASLKRLALPMGTCTHSAEHRDGRARADCTIRPIGVRRRPCEASVAWQSDDISSWARAQRTAVARRRPEAGRPPDREALSRDRREMRLAALRRQMRVSVLGARRASTYQYP